MQTFEPEEARFTQAHSCIGLGLSEYCPLITDNLFLMAVRNHSAVNNPLSKPLPLA